MTLKLHVAPKTQDEKVAVCKVAFESPIMDFKVAISLCACLKAGTEARASWSGTAIGSWTVYILKGEAIASRLVFACGTKQLFECGPNLDLGDGCCKRIRCE